MANPTPRDVKGTTAPEVAFAPAAPLEAAVQDASTEAEADKPKGPRASGKPAKDTEPARFRVLKAFTLADGRTVMPGEEFTPDDSFPARRPKQLVEQKYLRPINDTARGEATADPAEDE